MSDWRPIDTAPRDGTSVLLYDGCQMAVAYWGSDSYDPKAEPDEWLMAGSTYFFGEDHNAHITVDAPTHWMPLPESPK